MTDPKKPKTVTVMPKRDFAFRLSTDIEAETQRAVKGVKTDVLEKDVDLLRASGRIE